ncbi:MAG TPA: EamA family transporter [Gammaproteobacteria bacterium]|nr:EamA family transporter [Gammaproteobacteria bacterium]
MNWLILAFSGPVLWAASTHIDKYLVERYFKHSDVAVLLVFTALIGLGALPFILCFQPAVLGLSFKDTAVIACSGVLYMAAMYFYLKALQGEEASRVAPFFQAGPVFAYALAYLVLGEALSRGQLLGGGLIVCGGLLLSLRSGGGGRRFQLRLAVLMLSCALILAVSSVIFKAFAVRDDFWSTIFWTYFGEALFGFWLLALPGPRRQFFALLRRHTRAVLGVNAANELINLGGGLAARYAVLLAPLSLVQAIGSTTTLFVFLFGVLLSLFWPRYGREDLSRGNLLRKGAAALLVTGGVLVLSR